MTQKLHEGQISMPVHTIRVRIIRVHSRSAAECERCGGASWKCLLSGFLQKNSADSGSRGPGLALLTSASSFNPTLLWSFLYSGVLGEIYKGCPEKNPVTNASTFHSMWLDNFCPHTFKMFVGQNADSLAWYKDLRPTCSQTYLSCPDGHLPYRDKGAQWPPAGEHSTPVLLSLRTCALSFQALSPADVCRTSHPPIKLFQASSLL